MGGKDTTRRVKVQKPPPAMEIILSTIKNKMAEGNQKFLETLTQTRTRTQL